MFSLYGNACLSIIRLLYHSCSQHTHISYNWGWVYVHVHSSSHSYSFLCYLFSVGVLSLLWGEFKDFMYKTYYDLYIFYSISLSTIPTFEKMSTCTGTMLPWCIYHLCFKHGSILVSCIVNKMFWNVAKDSCKIFNKANPTRIFMLHDVVP